MYKKITYALMIISITSCGLFDSNEDGFTDKVRIIPKKGVDGVKFGDSFEDVVSILGEPSPGGSEATGPYRSWISRRYEKGKYAGLYLYFIHTADVRYGPVDFFVLDTSYSGKTAKGIGIGSTVEEFKAAYGEPVKTKPSGSWLDYFYCFERKKFELMIEDGIVKRMSIGFYIPLENTPYN